MSQLTTKISGLTIANGLIELISEGPPAER
jgi:hypothetical protein